MQAPSRKEGINVYHPSAVCHSSEDETDDVYTTNATISSSTSGPMMLGGPARTETQPVSAYRTQLKMALPLLSQDVNVARCIVRALGNCNQRC